MTGYFDLKHTPIKETILSISFSNNVTIDCLKKFKELELIRLRFPNAAEGFNTSLTSDTPTSPPIADVQKSGFILRCEPPCNRILQAKRGLLAFHLTKEHEPFANILKEFDEYWSLFQECTSSLNVTQVSLRYLNFISKEDDEKPDDLVTIITKSPFPMEESFFNQVKFKVPQDKTVTATIVTTIGKEQGKLGIILDITLQRKYEQRSFENISKAFDGMREIKNNIFRDSITETTLNKYKQDK